MKSTSASSKKTVKPWQFQAGQSGNPSGRSKRTQEEVELIKACKQRGLEALGVLIKIMETGKEANRLKAALAILERGYGKPQQPVVGKDGKDMFDKIEIVFVAAGVRENVD